MRNQYDVIVCGLGAMGSAALFQLSQKNLQVLGIDQFTPPHALGSSHGESRITRQSLGEGEYLLNLVKRSNEIWRDMEQKTGRKLFVKTGVLVIGKTENKFYVETIRHAKKHDIKHKILTAKKLRKKFPQFRIFDYEEGYLEEDAGFLKPELCIRTNLDLAEASGATIHANEMVTAISSRKNYVLVKTNKTTYISKKVIITTGPWIKKFIPKANRNSLTIYRQVSYWFDVEKRNAFAIGKFPIFIRQFPDAYDDNCIYGFPLKNNGYSGVKFGIEQYKTSTTMKSFKRKVTVIEIERMYRDYINPFFHGIKKECIKAVACPYTETPDHVFIIDFSPANSNIIIASPCSGHGFKHSAAIGEIVADLAINGKSRFNISQFSFKRFLSS